MAREIERKFLVAGDGWNEDAGQARAIRQGYLSADRAASVRVRIVDDARAMLTIKTGGGLSRNEFEYEIPLDDGLQILEACNGDIVEKTRHVVPHGGYEWEVDVYGGRHEGLVVAEVEMQSEADDPELPGWLGEEVTGDQRWSNAALATSDAPPH